jgi:hypothetical protein
MGTRSLTRFIAVEQESTRKIWHEIATMYRQYDGHPERHGLDLAKAITESETWGIDCLAATVVAKLKKGPGNIRLVKPSTNNVGEEYEYVIEENRQGKLTMSCYDSFNELMIFTGTPEQFIEQYSKVEA